MSSRRSECAAAAQRRPHRHYELIQDLYVLLDDCDRRVLGDFGLSTSQYRALMQLEAGDGLRLTTLSQHLLVSKSTVSRAVDQLEAAGWAARITDPLDRRAQRVILTPQGALFREKITAAHQHMLDPIFAVLSGDELRQLRLLLDKLRAGLVERLHSHGS